jgi:ribosome-binding factor A
MPELTFSFDTSLEANHVSSEDTQAQLDEFRQMPWIKPDYKAATLDALRKAERYWRRYSPSALRLQSGVYLGRISFAD